MTIDIHLLYNNHNLSSKYSYAKCREICDVIRFVIVYHPSLPCQVIRNTHVFLCACVYMHICSVNFFSFSFKKRKQQKIHPSFNPYLSQKPMKIQSLIIIILLLFGGPFMLMRFLPSSTLFTLSFFILSHLKSRFFSVRDWVGIWISLMSKLFTSSYLKLNTKKNMGVWKPIKHSSMLFSLFLNFFIYLIINQ